MNINENIKNFRIFRGIKQQELATQLKKSKSVISNWERGENSPDLESCQQLCKILRVTPNQLFGWEPCPDYEVWKKEISKNERMINDLELKIKTLTDQVTQLKEEQNKLKEVESEADDEPMTDEEWMNAFPFLRDSFYSKVDPTKKKK